MPPPGGGGGRLKQSLLHTFSATVRRHIVATRFRIFEHHAPVVIITSAFFPSQRLPSGAAYRVNHAGSHYRTPYRRALWRFLHLNGRKKKKKKKKKKKGHFVRHTRSRQRIFPIPAP